MWASVITRVFKIEEGGRRRVQSDETCERNSTCSAGFEDEKTEQ